MRRFISEEDLISGCIEGSRYAQKVLYEKYHSLMFAICIRYAKSKDEAEDVLIQGFMKIFTGIKDFRNEGSFEGWMKRIMVRTAINNYRLNFKHYNNFNIDAALTFEVKDDEDVFSKTYSADYLIKIIQELPEGFRIIFNMFEIEGYTHKEIAEILGINIGTSKSQLFYAKRMLRNKLSKIDQGEIY